MHGNLDSGTVEATAWLMQAKVYVHAPAKPNARLIRKDGFLY